MKKLIILLLLIASPAFAFNKINDNYIVLLTSVEARTFEAPVVEDITRQRAELTCGLLGKALVDYSYKEIKQEYILDKPKKDGIITMNEVKYYKIPTQSSLIAVSAEQLETHYHRGGATVAILTLGFVPIIIPYHARIIDSIECTDFEEQKFTTN